MQPLEREDWDPDSGPFAASYPTLPSAWSLTRSFPFCHMVPSGPEPGLPGLFCCPCWRDSLWRQVAPSTTSVMPLTLLTGSALLPEGLGESERKASCWGAWSDL